MELLISLACKLLETMGLNWWKKHEALQKQEPLTNAEEISDIDKLPRA